MRQLLILAILLSLSVLGAEINERYQTGPASVSASLENVRLAPFTPAEDADEQFPETTVMSKTFALPFTEASLQVGTLLWNVFDRQGNFLYEEQDRGQDDVTLAKSFTFREMQGFTVLIQTQKDDGQRIRTLKNAEFTLSGSVPAQLPQSVSPAFVHAYKTLADNYDTSYLRDLPVARPKMLIISHSSLSDYQQSFIDWKRSVGFDVQVAYKTEIGTTLDQFKAFIRNHYETHHCDYLLLLGDVTGTTYTIPTAFFPSPEYAENDADDHQYTLLAGDDYFPEMLVGRFSFNDVSEFMTIAGKTISYEKTPSMVNTAWMQRSLAVAGNYAEGGLRPTTPVYMSRWLREKMLDYGYAQVDTVFYPPTYPGTSLIQSAINQGVQFVSYRGWGDANGWHYPSFHIPDLNSTANGPRMPIVFSIVCNTGDYANSVNPCFGEKWMRMGSVSQPNGAVAFVGPSDLHTKTRLNNSISSGAFRSILDDGVRGFGSAILAGKMELYKNFPNDIANNQYVAFYFHVYNLLSDPSLNMWVLVPETIPESVIDGGLTFAQSDSHIRVVAANLEGATVSGKKPDGDYTYATVSDGFAILPIDPETAGDLTLTVSKPNFVPLARTLAASETAGLGVTANSVAGQILHPNHDVDGTITLKNYGSASVTVPSLTLDAAAGTAVTYQHSEFTLAPGASHAITFQIQGGNLIQPQQALTFTLAAGSPGFNYQFQMVGGGARFNVVDVTGILDIGATSTATYRVMNTGPLAFSDAEVRIVSLSNAATVPSAPIALGSFATGAIKSFDVPVTVASGAWNGRNLPMRLIIGEGSYEYQIYSVLTAGVATPQSPTGPDEYGYFAYDSNDAGHAQTPVYQWVEADPLLGGQGSVFEVMDDGSHTVDLPFNFQFYGTQYNQLTMCSNGWISLIPTDMVDFYNCYIPAALGPYAMIAGYWDDLKGLKTGVDTEGNGIFNDMRLIYWHDAANNRYIVQWNDAYNQYNIDLMDDASLEKFQIILYPQSGRDGDIVVQYHTVDNPGTTTNYSTVGIEDETQLIGLQYTHGNAYPPTASPLQAGLAVKFTTVAPDTYVANDDQVLPAVCRLEQNYPNPFNPTTSISFSLQNPGPARLSIYNLKGQLVKTLLDGDAAGGRHTLTWNGTDAANAPVSSGLYFYSLDHAGQTQIRKMLLMK